MDFFSVLRMFGALAVVLGMLAGALWLVRRYDIRLPGRVGNAREQRLEIVERITIDQRRSLLLIRRDGQEHLLLLSPEGHVVVDRASGDAPDGQVPPYAMLMAQAIERLWQRVGEDNARRAPALEVAGA